MNSDWILSLLQRVSRKDISIEEAEKCISKAYAENLGFAVIDHQRAERKGFPEVIYGVGKQPRQAAEIAERIFERSSVVMVTRASREIFSEVSARIPEAHYNEVAQIVWADRRKKRQALPGVSVVSAGTSDEPIAEEAALTAELMGCKVSRITDVGIAGLHRLLSRLEELQASKVIVAVAGMEGALPGVISGLVACPVIGVPTSVGYRTHIGGFAALLTMLNSCASGLSVVNIDGGYAAGYQAAMILGATKPSS